MGKSADVLTPEMRRHLYVWESGDLEVLLFNKDLRLLQTSQNALSLLQEMCGFSADNERLTPSYLPSAVQRLLQRLRAQLRKQQDGIIAAKPFARSVCVTANGRHYLVTGVSVTVTHRKSDLDILLTVERLPARSRTISTLNAYDLTPREKEITMLVLQGLTNHKIAEQLFITEQTVKDHLRIVYRKLEVASRTELLSKLLWARQYH